MTVIIQTVPTYLITFTTYGSWLRGDARGSVDKHKDGIQPENYYIRQHDRNKLKHDPVLLDVEQRRVVEQTIVEVCEHRKWHLLAVNVRTNHLHMVVVSADKPEKIMADCKSYATRQLRKSGLVDIAHTIWTEGGSMRTLGTEKSIERAIHYVLEGQ